jgi:predicted O-methyltransferase YrrM
MFKQPETLPVEARHIEHSLLLSADDDPACPSDYLIDLSLKAIDEARRVSLTDVSDRLKQPPFWPDVWPGEHYKLLAALVRILKPSKVIEIGTFTGMASLTMSKYLPPGSKLFTYDVVGWETLSDTCFRPNDFADRKMQQVLDDLSDPATMQNNAHILKDAELIFVDGPKDGQFEPRFLENLKLVEFKRPTLLLFDDIRLWNMLSVWRNITKPKLDLTSFGHWSGTGLLEWTIDSPD